MEVRALQLKDQQKICMLSSNVGVPYTTLRHLMKKGHLRRHTSALKPLLTEENKVARVSYALDEVDGATLGGDGVVAQFKNMYNRVDINEKWLARLAFGQ
jgi:hypothetical protein